MVDPKSWQNVHAALVVLASKKAGLEYEELALLLAADRTRAWFHMGNGSMGEYADRVLGIDGHTLAEKIRTAGKLETLVHLGAALREGRLSYSAVRELSRVATAETESEWVAYASGKTVRQLEARVRACSEGDRPGDPTRPDLAKRILRLELDPETFALVVAALDSERSLLGIGATQEQALRSLVERGKKQDDAGVAPVQVAYTVCDSCQRAWVDAPRERIEIPPEAGERACCDANVIPSPARPAARASQTVAPSMRREVVRRAGGRCEVPGCRVTFSREVHHVVLRSEGGGHGSENLVVLCGRHHDLVHQGLLTVERKGDAVGAVHADGTVYGASPRPAEIEAASEAFAALREYGFREGEIRPVLTEIREACGVLPTERIVMEALKRIGARKYAMSGATKVGELVVPYGGPTWDGREALHA